VWKCIIITVCLLHVSATDLAILREVSSIHGNAPSCRWPHGRPKHVAVYCVHKLISVYLCASVGTIVVYIGVMHWSWSVWIGCAFAFVHFVKTHLSIETDRCDVYRLYEGTQSVNHNCVWRYDIVCLDCDVFRRTLKKPSSSELYTQKNY